MIHAYVNHGRWIADCPVCNSALIVSASSPFFGCQCGFETAVQFPPESEQIERALAARPEVNRNWRVGESLADLAIENAVHGVTS